MTNVRQFSFSAGEIAPVIHARTDLLKYSTGLRTCRNNIVMRHGGVSNRPGTGFIAEVKDSTKAVRLIPFVFNASQTYILEFGDLYIRVHRNGAPVLEATTSIIALSQTNPCQFTSAPGAYSEGDEIHLNDAGGMTEINGRSYILGTELSSDVYELKHLDGTNVDSTGYTAFTSGGTAARVYEVTTTYVEADLSDIAFIQSADIVTLVHPSYKPAELARSGHATWTLTDITFGAALAAPANLLSSSPGANFKYKVTAVDATTNEESLPSAEEDATTKTSTLTWDAVLGAGKYNIYRESAGIFGWIGVAETESFKDADYSVDVLDAPPVDRQPFATAGNYPSTLAFYQQRLIFANTNNNPEGVWASKSGLRKNFMISTPLQDDDAVTFSLVGREVNEVRHLVDAGKLIIFTSSGEWAIEGNAAGILLPGEINPRQHTSNGAANLRPLNVGGNNLYVQARGAVIRDLAYDFQSDGYKGDELSIFSSHLFDNRTLVDWAYQQIPHSIVWAVRDDGILLGMTYVREHEVFAWHRHDFDGTVENVACIPEGTENVLYLIIKRTIDGRTVRYLEAMKSRQIDDIVDLNMTDCSLDYDGRNTNTSHTMTLSGGSTWDHGEALTLTSSTGFFVATDVGNEVHLKVIENEGEDDEIISVIRCVITAFTSDLIVTVNPEKLVPASLQGVATSIWTFAVDVLGGLWHLEGKDLSVFADGFVAASANNNKHTVLTVTNGQVTLDKPYGVIHAGLPITADFETLDIDTPQGSSLSDKKKNISRVTLFVESSRGIFVGSNATNLTEVKVREDEPYDAPVALATGTVELNIAAEWNSKGSIFIRQIDPVPLSVLAVVPSGLIGGLS